MLRKKIIPFCVMCIVLVRYFINCNFYIYFWFIFLYIYIYRITGKCLFNGENIQEIQHLNKTKEITTKDLDVPDINCIYIHIFFFIIKYVYIYILLLKAKILLMVMLSYNPKNRITCEDALKSEYFKGI